YNKVEDPHCPRPEIEAKTGRGRMNSPIERNAVETTSMAPSRKLASPSGLPLAPVWYTSNENAESSSVVGLNLVQS
ncbi:MAG: hypothetical protein ACREPG_01690, partial [Candidatus Binatia bacterium]